MQHRKVAQSQSHSQLPSEPVGKPAHPADRHVGRQVALLRLQFRTTQADLAKGIGLSVQQLQKYESAKNRISASILFEIAGFFNVPVARLFQGLPGNEQATAPSALLLDDHVAFAASVEGRRLTDGLMSLPPRVRHRVSSFVTALSEELGQTEGQDQSTSHDRATADKERLS